MAFKNNFCSSPWFHMRITNNGDYEFCRWADENLIPTKQNISQVQPITWFQTGMASIRQDMLNGVEIPACKPCRTMEEHGKISGRQKQLLKAGVTLKDFEKTMLSSPWVDEWKTTQEKHGEISGCVQDWQIDLGNYCNSACLFCDPKFSSRLATEHRRLGLIKNTPPPSWCDDPKLLNQFVENLKNSPKLQYLHFIGGETIITPAFRTILRELINAGLNKNLTLGFTTNLTVIDDEIIDLLHQFYQINLGMSVECLDPVNDYVRYGGNLDETRYLLDKWVSIGKEKKWALQIRSTPTILSIPKLTTIYDYAWENHIIIESCNFIEHPKFMRPAVLPMIYRNRVRDKLQDWLDQRNQAIQSEQIINIRNPEFVHQQILQDMQSYIRYLDNESDQSYLLPDLIHYLKLMESSRKNRVLDYLPEYEELFRTAGY